jgi:Golgi phosphoprotein 3 GPP34
METLGEDLALLSVGPNGKVQQPHRLAIALAGSELVRLAARGKAEVADGRIVVRDAVRTGSAELDLALESLARAGRPPKAKAWVGHPRRGIVAEYLGRLAESGALRSEHAFLGSRWQVTDPGRAAAAAARLDAIARSSGPVDTDGTAFGGLAHAAGLGVTLYRGWANREPRARLKRIAEGKAEGKVAGAGPAEAAIADAARGTALAADAASRTADHAAAQAAVSAAAAAAAAAAATQAAAEAATQAALDAATQAAVRAATHAAVQAATQAAAQAADAGGHGGAAGGHGH